LVLYDPAQSKQLFILRNLVQVYNLEYDITTKARPLENFDNGSRIALVGTIVGQENTVPGVFYAANKLTKVTMWRCSRVFQSSLPIATSLLETIVESTLVVSRKLSITGAEGKNDVFIRERQI
jgi:hypothetical protein